MPEGIHFQCWRKYEGLCVVYVRSSRPGFDKVHNALPTLTQVESPNPVMTDVKEYQTRVRLLGKDTSLR
jgi:hypothetical protein